MVVDPLIGLIAGYAVLVVVSLRRGSALAAIAAMITVYAILSSTPTQLFMALINLLDWNDIRVFIFIWFSLFIAGILKEVGVLNRMVSGFSSITCRGSMVGVPALIGLLPMPGGALVSAMALRDQFFSTGLSREWATFINYWFRHVWVPVWPLFQSILITAAVLEIDPLAVVNYSWPAGVIALIMGLAVSVPVLAKIRCNGGNGRLYDLAYGLWPFLAIALIAFGTPLGLLGSLIVTAFLVILIYKPRMAQIKAALRFATSPRIHAILLEALFFKELLIITSAPQSLMEASHGLPVELIVFLTPFIMGLSAGGENFFAATAMPLLRDIIGYGANVDGGLLLLAYAGGFLGVMMSPVHLCIVLTTEYFHASPAKVLGIVFIATLLSSIASFMLVEGLALIS